jgi:spoIIIJ-associated protein
VGVPGEGFGTVTGSEDTVSSGKIIFSGGTAGSGDGVGSDGAVRFEEAATPAAGLESSDEDLEDVVDDGFGDEADDEAAEDDGEDDADDMGSLEEEGEIAADYIEGLLDIADLDGDIDMDVEGDRAVVSVVGATLNELVGADGEVLEALQELTRLAVHRKTGARARLMLDVGGFRARRRVELADLGRSVAEEVSRTGEPKKLRAMSPFERKIIHDAVASAGLRSESEGEEPNRRVVVFPAG